MISKLCNIVAKLCGVSAIILGVYYMLMMVDLSPDTELRYVLMICTLYVLTLTFTLLGLASKE